MISFLLTSVLGVGLSQYFSGYIKNIEQARLEIETRKIAVQNISRLFHERHVRSSMLASAIRRNAQLDEIKDRKKNYDEVYARWNSNHISNLFLIRDIISIEDFSVIERSMRERLLAKGFSPLDRCLTNAYDGVISEKSGQTILVECNNRNLLDQTLNCGFTIFDQLYRLVGKEVTRAEASKEIEGGCPN